jgi:hypothetical protein
VAAYLLATYRLSRAVAYAGHGGMVEVEDESMTGDRHAFRVRQVNSRWAWSSPIWAEG